jgi:glutamine synthetase
MNISKQIFEYVWIGGKGEIRSKTRVFHNSSIPLDGDVPKWFNINFIPKWNYDGSSTWQADSNKNTEVILKPCAIFKDPLRVIQNVHCYLVLCDTYDDKDEPLQTNSRFIAKEIFDKKTEDFPWFGLEQEYYIQPKTPLFTFNSLGVGYHYCGNADLKIERIIVEEHLAACITAGLTISGINAEVVERQWEYQIGPCCGIDSGDQFIIARYLLEKIAEKYEANIDFQPKPYPDKNGSGCHINFSTANMRTEDGIEEIYKCMSKLEKKHQEHLQVYGSDNEKRLTGIHETSSYEKFSWGVGTRNTSVRIPNQTLKDGRGYFEDRRPASNIDPYLSTSILFKTCCLDNIEEK